jgi:hypothetical protein
MYIVQIRVVNGRDETVHMETREFSSEDSAISAAIEGFITVLEYDESVKE